MHFNSNIITKKGLNKSLKVVMFFLAIFSFNVNAKAQLVVDFSINESDTVCVPDSRSYSNLSTYNGVLISASHPDIADFEISWFLGPNSSPINVINPTIAYTVSGVFDVTLTIRNKKTGEVETITKAKYVYAFDPPRVSFSFDNSKGCAPLQVNFTDLSIPVGGPIVKYNWAISGVGTSTAQNPTFNFNSVGLFPVNFKVTDINGCTADSLLVNAVEVLDDPIATFSAPNTLACSPPLDVELTADQTGPFTYSWEVPGIGNFSGNPVNVSVSANGTYDVKLTVDGPFGCSETQTIPSYIVVGEPIADFTFDTPLCSGNDIVFHNTSIGNGVFEWDFGDGSPIVEDDANTVSHRYPSGGTFDVTLTVTSESGLCSNTITKTITIEEIVADFVADERHWCESPFIVNFDNSSSIIPPGSTLDWDFGNGTSGTGDNPSATYEYEDYFDLPNNNDKWNVTLTITSPSGCSVRKKYFNYIKISPLELRLTSDFSLSAVLINRDKNDGCAPLTVAFADQGNYRGFPINVKRIWDWGDGTPIDSTPNNGVSSHVFQEHSFDDYWVKLTIRTENGCSQIDSILITPGIQPIPHFTFNPTINCASDTTFFFDSSYVQVDGLNRFDLIDTWNWEFGLPLGDVRDGDQNPEIVHRFVARDSAELNYAFIPPDTLLNYGVELEVSYKGCDTTIERLNIYEKYGALAVITKSEYLCTKNKFALSARVRGDTAFVDVGGGVIKRKQPFYWYLNDAIYDTISTNEIDTIALPPGLHWLKVYAENHITGCDYVDSVQVQVPETEVDFTIPDTVCLFDSDRNNYILESYLLNKGTSTITNIRWFINGDLVQNGAVLQPYTIPGRGLFEVKVLYDVGFGSFSCNDAEIIKTLRVLEPKPDIELEDGLFSGCAPLIFNVKGQATGEDNIVDWQWAFIRTSNQDTLGTYSGIDPPLITVDSNDIYKMALTVTDVFGCISSAQVLQTITVLDPTPQFEVLQKYYCPGDSLRVKNTSEFPGKLFYHWETSSGLVSDDSIPKFQLMFPDTIDISLTVTDGVNCTKVDTMYEAVIVEPIPQLNPTASDLSANCPPLNTFLYSGVTPAYDYDFKWYIVGQPIIQEDTAFIFIQEPGVYDVSVVAMSPNAQCKDSVFIPNMLTVDGPIGELIQDRDTICIEDNVTFTVINGKNISEINWVFGDGNSAFSSSSNDSIKSNQYLVTGLRDVTVFLDPVTASNPNGCNVPLETKVFINELIAGFNISDDTLCGPGDITFTDTSLGVNYSFAWDLDLGITNILDPVVTQEYPLGQFNITLAITDNVSGCTHSTSSPVWVFNPPTAEAGPDSIICAGETYFLQGSGADIYSWFPTDSLSDPNVANPFANPDTTTKYFLTVTDDIGCQHTDSVLVFRDETRVGFILSEDTACGELLVAITDTSYGANQKWNYGDGTGTQFGFQPEHEYTIAGEYTITQYVYDLSSRCEQSAQQSIKIFPIPVIVKGEDTLICQDDIIQILASGGDSITWETSPPTSTVPDGFNPFVSPHDSTAYIFTVYDMVSLCSNTDTIIVDTDSSYAYFDITILDSCGVGEVLIDNISDALIQNLDLGDGAIVPAETQTHTYGNVGNYTITYTVSNKTPLCASSFDRKVRIYPVPVAQVNDNGIICDYDYYQLEASGGVNYVWTPEEGLSDPTVANPLAQPIVKTTYQVLVNNEFQCFDSIEVTVDLHPDFTYTPPFDTTIVIGEPVYYSLNPSMDVAVKWTPNVFIDCDNCYDITSIPLETTCYTVVLEDAPKCYPKTTDFCINVEEKYSLDVPQAFSPNGDFNNDIVYVKGWGIKDLKYFTIYNRFGEEVFKSEELEIGWNGYYKGVLQNDETYVYQVKAEMLNGEMRTKKGYLTLVK